MTKKDCDILISVLASQQAMHAKISERAGADGDKKGKAFQAGASMAFEIAIGYVKDAQVGILRKWYYEQAN